MSYHIESRQRIQTEAARNHLDRAGEKYLDSINGVSPESLIFTVHKLSPLKEFLPHPSRIVSLGTGQGEEIHALHELYADENPQVVGVDLSSVALRRAMRRSRLHEYSDGYIQGSLTQLPLRSEGVDGLVSSAIMHEVYSYLPNGRQAWEQAVKESFRVIKPGGYMLFREFAGPDINPSVPVQFTTREARRFYEYFKADYRVFRSWSTEEAKRLKDKRDSEDNDFPLLQSDGSTEMPLKKLGEVLLHFRNFWNDWQKGTTDFGDAEWKEINESYLIPHSGSNSKESMSPVVYRDAILAVANRSLQDQEKGVECAMFSYSRRPEMVEFLSRHVSLGVDSANLLDQITRKLVAVFSVKRK